MLEQKEPDLRAFWGKSGRANQGEEAVPHPLICHIIDTAVVAELLYDVLLGASCRAQLAEAFAPLGGAARDWVALLCGLHDLGKLSPAFQALRADVAREHLTGTALVEVERLHAKRVRGGRTDTPHGVLTAYHIRRLLRAWGASKDSPEIVAQAMGGHHGSFFSSDVLRNAALARYDHGGEQWALRAEEMVRRTGDLLGLPDPGSRNWSKVTIGSGAAVALAGLATVSDWVASGSIGKATHAGVDVDLPEYVRFSRDRAREQVAGRLGWSAGLPPGGSGFARLFGEDPRPLQRAIEHMIAGRTTPGILVIEAPTGEGKTKAALQCTVSLIRQLRLAGFFVAMPTRATSNQVFNEVDALLAGLDAGLSAKLLHGTAAEYLADRRAQAARAEPIRPEDVGDDASGGLQDAQVREWFTRIRALLAPLAVGTIDRILQGGIRSRWAAVPLVGLSNRVVVLDEVHGYEIYMSTILDRLLWWLGWLGVPVILLSATLPGVRRAELIRSWYAGTRRCGPDEVDVVLPPMGYPRAVWLDGRGAPIPVEAEASGINAGRLAGLSRVSDEDLVGWALERAARGLSVAIIHNIVGRVSRTGADLVRAIASLPEGERPRLVHLTGQLNNARRAAVEAELRTLFGPEGRRAPEAGFIVVGTQVLEQSLDLDFDAMATDPAPVDSLIQRAGRLHRFRPTDRDASPELAIVGVTERMSGPKWPAHTTRIYQDMMLLRTWVLLRDRTELRMPDEVPRLVDAVYSGPDAVQCPAGWEKRWDDAAAMLRRAHDADSAMARSLFLPAPSHETALTLLTQHPRNTAQTRKPAPWRKRDG